MEHDFFKTKMPASRKADYYLGCLDGSVFIDFNRSKTNLISLARISFDGYGCCEIEANDKHMGIDNSLIFIHEIEKEELNQDIVTMLVKDLITLNKNELWLEAIEEYDLINKE